MSLRRGDQSHKWNPGKTKQFIFVVVVFCGPFCPQKSNCWLQGGLFKKKKKSAFWKSYQKLKTFLTRVIKSHLKKNKKLIFPTIFKLKKILLGFSIHFLGEEFFFEMLWMCREFVPPNGFRFWKGVPEKFSFFFLLSKRKFLGREGGSREVALGSQVIPNFWGAVKFQKKWSPPFGNSILMLKMSSFCLENEKKTQFFLEKSDKKAQNGVLIIIILIKWAPKIIFWEGRFLEGIH